MASKSGGTTRGHAVLITLAFPPQLGGMQRLMAERVRLAADEMVVVAPNRGEADAWDARQAFPIWRWPGGPGGLPGWRRVRQMIGAWQGLRWARAQGKVTALELGQALPFGLVALWARARFGLPYRVWAFGDEVIKPARRPVVRQVLVRVLNEAAAIYAISEYTAGLLRELGIPPTRVHVVHPWPAPRFQPGDKAAARRFLRLPPKGPLLLTVARLEARKGVDRVLALLPRLIRVFPHLRYAVVGQGRARPHWQALARRLGVADHVLWPGRVDDQTLVRWYQAADLFVLIPTPGPGEVEGFGLVYVEAGACGIPSVAGDNGGVREAVLHGRTGLVVPPGDEVALFEALRELLRNSSLRARMGRSAWEHAQALRRDAAHVFDKRNV